MEKKKKTKSPRRPTDPNDRSFIKPNGRPPEITDELTEKICKAIVAGCYAETACQLEGISKSTFYKWCKRGNAKNPKKSDQIYIRFVNAVQKALAQSETRDILVLDKAAQQGNWNAAAWRLQRKHPQRWGSKDSLHLVDKKKDLEPEASHDQIMKLLAEWEKNKKT